MPPLAILVSLVAALLVVDVLAVDAVAVDGVVVVVLVVVALVVDEVHDGTCDARRGEISGLLLARGLDAETSPTDQVPVRFRDR